MEEIIDLKEADTAFEQMEYERFLTEMRAYVQDAEQYLVDRGFIPTAEMLLEKIDADIIKLKGQN
jgi:hypothetical protein